MADRTVIQFPAVGGKPAEYTDTAAMNDIHAVLCGRHGSDPSVLRDIALILARAGRKVIETRDIAATVTDSPTGLPQAHVDAGGTKLLVFQDDHGAIVVRISATAADMPALQISLNNRRLHPAATG